MTTKGERKVRRSEKWRTTTRMKGDSTLLWFSKERRNITSLKTTTKKVATFLFSLTESC